MFATLTKPLAKPGARNYHLKLFKQAQTHAASGRVAIVNKDGKEYTYANLLNDSNYVSDLLRSKFVSPFSSSQNSE
jgi:hypothetical protein